MLIDQDFVLEGRGQKEKPYFYLLPGIQAESFKAEEVPTHLELNSRWNVALAFREFGRSTSSFQTTNLLPSAFV